MNVNVQVVTGRRRLIVLAGLMPGMLLATSDLLIIGMDSRAER